MGDKQGHPFRGNQYTAERAEGLGRYVPRVLGTTDPVKKRDLGRLAAQIEANQGWEAKDEAGIATLLRQADAQDRAERAARGPEHESMGSVRGPERDRELQAEPGTARARGEAFSKFEQSGTKLPDVVEKAMTQEERNWKLVADTQAAAKRAANKRRPGEKTDAYVQRLLAANTSDPRAAAHAEENEMAARLRAGMKAEERTVAVRRAANLDALVKGATHYLANQDKIEAEIDVRSKPLTKTERLRMKAHPELTWNDVLIDRVAGEGIKGKIDAYMMPKRLARKR